MYMHSEPLITPSRRVIMKMMIGLLLAMVLTTEADPRVKRYQVATGETGRYIGRTNPGDTFICHYYVHGMKYEISDHCENQNKEGIVVKGEKLYPWCYPGTGLFPSCGSLPEIRYGYWMCPKNVWKDSVEVYAVCAAKCLRGYHLEGDIVVRCPESLTWNNFTSPKCIPDHDPPERPGHVHVQVLNTTAVNVSWTSPVNDTSIIGYKVHITCDDNYNLSLNCTLNSLIISKLEVLKNYTITVTAFNQYKASLQSDPVYVELTDSCQLYNLSFITNIPHKVIVYWNATRECQDRNLILTMANEHGQRNTKYLKKNTSFLVFHQIGLDTDYRVYIFIEEKEVISGTFKSATMNPPERPRHVHVQVMNTTAVNVSWISPINDTFIIGYTVHITCDDNNSLTLNTTTESLIIPNLEVLKNYTITVTAFNQYKASLQSDPANVVLPGRKRKGKDETQIVSVFLFLMIALAAVVVLIIILFICIICVLSKRKKKIKGRGRAVSNEENREMLEMGPNMANNAGVKVENPARDPSISDRFLVQESEHQLHSNPPTQSRDSHEIMSSPPLDAQSLKSSEDSLDISEAPDLNCDSLSPREESSSMGNISQFPSSNEGLSSILEQIDTVEPVKRTQTGYQKKVPGSDSGRGSVAGTSSTTSDPADLKPNSSQGSDKLPQVPSYNHQISADSGRESETENATEHSGNYRSQTGSAKGGKAAAVICDVKKDIVNLISEAVEKKPNLQAQPFLTDISERSNEEDISLKSNQEDCLCTIAAFIDSPKSYQHLEDLGDLLDPDDYYGSLRSWKGFAKDVLKVEAYKIIAIGTRCKGGSPFRTEVLDYMKAQGTKIGHIVFYFSRAEHFRLDVLEKITKFHIGCKFCDNILKQYKLYDVKENEMGS